MDFASESRLAMSGITFHDNNTVHSLDLHQYVNVDCCDQNHVATYTENTRQFHVISERSMYNTLLQYSGVED